MKKILNDAQGGEGYRKFLEYRKTGRRRVISGKVNLLFNLGGRHY